MLRLALGLLTGFLALSSASAQPVKPEAKKPKFLYGHDLKVRKEGEQAFTKDTAKVGVEFFLDETANALLAISESGSMAVLPAGPIDENKKKAEWVAAFEVRVRAADVAEFKEAKKVAAEMFKDLASGKLLYITAAKTIALTDAPASLQTEKEPAFHHGLVVKVRGPKDADYSGAKKIGVETYKDGNTGGLVSLTETGTITTSTTPAKAPIQDAIKPPKGLYGLTLKIRGADEAEFTEKTRLVAVEVVRDPNTGSLLYLTEAGGLAAVPAPADVKAGDGLRWSHSFTVKARKGGDKEFEKAVKYSVEVFEDKNTGYLVYVNDTGAVAVLRK